MHTASSGQPALVVASSTSIATTPEAYMPSRPVPIPPSSLPPTSGTSFHPTVRPALPPPRSATFSTTPYPLPFPKPLAKASSFPLSSNTVLAGPSSPTYSPSQLPHSSLPNNPNTGHQTQAEVLFSSSSSSSSSSDVVDNDERANEIADILHAECGTALVARTQRQRLRTPLRVVNLTPADLDRWKDETDGNWNLSVCATSHAGARQQQQQQRTATWPTTPPGVVEYYFGSLPTSPTVATTVIEAVPSGAGVMRGNGVEMGDEEDQDEDEDEDDDEEVAFDTSKSLGGRGGFKSLTLASLRRIASSGSSSIRTKAVQKKSAVTEHHSEGKHNHKGHRRASGIRCGSRSGDMPVLRVTNFAEGEAEVLADEDSSCKDEDENDKQERSRFVRRLNNSENGDDDDADDEDDGLFFRSRDKSGIDLAIQKEMGANMLLADVPMMRGRGRSLPLKALRIMGEECLLAGSSSAGAAVAAGSVNRQELVRLKRESLLGLNTNHGADDRDKAVVSVKEGIHLDDIAEDAEDGEDTDESSEDEDITITHRGWYRRHNDEDDDDNENKDDDGSNNHGARGGGSGGFAHSSVQNVNNGSSTFSGHSEGRQPHSTSSTPPLPSSSSRSAKPQQPFALDLTDTTTIVSSLPASPADSTCSASDTASIFDIAFRSGSPLSSTSSSSCTFTDDNVENTNADNNLTTTTSSSYSASAATYAVPPEPNVFATQPEAGHHTLPLLIPAVPRCPTPAPWHPRGSIATRPHPRRLRNPIPAPVSLCTICASRASFYSPSTSTIAAAAAAAAAGTAPVPWAARASAAATANLQTCPTIFRPPPMPLTVPTSFICVPKPKRLQQFWRNRHLFDPLYTVVEARGLDIAAAVSRDSYLDDNEHCGGDGANSSSLLRSASKAKDEDKKMNKMSAHWNTVLPVSSPPANVAGGALSSQGWKEPCRRVDVYRRRSWVPGDDGAGLTVAKTAARQELVARRNVLRKHSRVGRTKCSTAF